MQTFANTWLHLQQPSRAPWRFLPWILALAFALRAAVALSGDFVLHPDEIMQYLEPAHRLVFGNGIMAWEFFHGGRSWLIPGFVAGILALLDRLGLGEPLWYVPAVKLAFCAVSLLIPAGMYFFGRRHFGETTARIAVVAGALWYELVAFAHKPMTEFVATALLMALLAVCVQPSRIRTVWLVAALAVLVTAIRLQYAPLALLLLGVVFLKTRHKALLVVAAVLCSLAVGIFDGATWDGSLFHSYVTNIDFNRAADQYRTPDLGALPISQYLWWLIPASAGLGVACLSASLFSLRRYGFLLALVALVLVPHTLQAHKEYRFIFVVVPLWLLLGSDLVAWLASRVHRWRRTWQRGAAALFITVSLGGILNALPHQQNLFYQWSEGGGTAVRFLKPGGQQDPAFAAYRYLAQQPDVQGLLHTRRIYFHTPGYYYLHHKIPFYDHYLAEIIVQNNEAPLNAFVSHVLTKDPDIELSGFRLDRQFGNIRVLRREGETPEIRRWERYVPVVDSPEMKVMQQVNPGAPAPPDWGIRLLN